MQVVESLQVKHPVMVELQNVQTPPFGYKVSFTQVKQYVADPLQVAQGEEHN